MTYYINEFYLVNWYNTFGQIDYEAANNNTMSLGIQQSFDSSKPLPANILEFTAIKQNEKVLLQWITTNQKNCKSFVVERSANGKNFNAEIASVSAINNSDVKHNYQSVDSKPNIGYNYYRLKITDNDGSFSYSNIVLVKFDTNSSIILYPNPTAKIVTVNLGFAPATNDNIICQLYNVEGKLIHSQKINNSVFQIDLTNQQKAIYLIIITTQFFLYN